MFLVLGCSFVTSVVMIRRISQLWQQNGDQLVFFSGCNPSILDSAEGSVLPDRCLVTEVST